MKTLKAFLLRELTDLSESWAAAVALLEETTSDYSRLPAPGGTLNSARAVRRNQNVVLLSAGPTPALKNERVRSPS